MMYRTLLLDQQAWDLVLDASGNIAVADPPYALTQDVASAIRLFLGELYYDTSKGVPYFDEVLGHTPSTAVIVQLMIAAAKTVPGVVDASCVISAFNSRSVIGQVQFIDESGVSTVVNF